MVDQRWWRTLAAVILVALTLGGCVQSAPKPQANIGVIGGPLGFTGGKIAFTRFILTKPQIFVMNADGSGQKGLTQGMESADFPSWSPDGTKLAFVGSTGPFRQLYVMNADGSGRKALTRATQVGTQAPTWSPDGRKIAYRANQSPPNIYVVSVDNSSAERRLHQNLPSYSGDPDWRGDNIVISEFDAGGKRFGIHVGKGLAFTSFTLSLRLTTRRDKNPAWSPDGNTIAFDRREQDGSNPHVLVMNANDGSGQRRVAPQLQSSANPTWSPDGTTIAFQAPSSERPELDVFSIKLDATGVTNLTDSPAIEMNPDWQPRQPLGVPPLDFGTVG